jgi:hypothetical protein
MGAMLLTAAVGAGWLAAIVLSNRVETQATAGEPAADPVEEPGKDFETEAEARSGGIGGEATSDGRAREADTHRWQRVQDGPTLGGDDFQEMISVTVGGLGLVAVGRDGSSAAVWTSTDGTSWQRVPHDEQVLGGGGQQIMGSVAVEETGRLVGVGGDWGRGSAAVWTSTDGTSWQRVPHDEQNLSDALMSSVTVGGPGLVAVGSDLRQGSAAVWTTADGTSWQRVHDDAELRDSAMNSVSAGGPGLVAVGLAGGSAAAWTSTDGTSWQRIAHDEQTFGGDGQQAMNSVTDGGPGLVAVGRDVGRGSAAVWTSTDGISWQRVPHDEQLTGVSMNAVTVGEPGIVAVGADGGSAAVWTSTDGTRWQRIAHDEQIFGGNEQQEIWSVAAAEHGLVAVGRDAGRGSAAVWTSP